MGINGGSDSFDETTCRIMKSVTIEAPAKINLGLKITGIRPDGFHSLESIFSTITLVDTMEISFNPDDTGLSLSTSGIFSPPGEANLVWKTARAFFEETQIEGRVHISLQKNIPSPGGLGGGSSDAASVLKALKELTGASVNLKALGEKMGSDVPFFLCNSEAAFVKGRGEIIEPATLPPFHCVLVHSGENIPTPMAFNLWDQRNGGLTKACIINNYTALNFGAWHEGKPFPVKLDNCFLQLLLDRYPGVTRTVEELSQLTPDWGLSGSGPAFYALFRSSAEAKDAEEYLSGKFPWVFRCQSR